LGHFPSTTATQAETYAVEVDSARAADAVQVLDR
jgi:hypothetical protein